MDTFGTPCVMNVYEPTKTNIQRLSAQKENLKRSQSTCTINYGQ